MNCVICGIRRARRHCPGVRGDICSICCGTEREVTVDCPFECEYLQEARLREKPPVLDPATFPHQDIRVTETFLRDHEPLLTFLAATLLHAAFQVPGVIDNDVREALDALVRTYRTLESGLYYDSRPSNPLAAHIYIELQKNLQAFRERVTQETGMNTIRDSEILGILVFLQRMEMQENNGRRKGKAFLDVLRHNFPPRDEGGEAPPAAPLLVQG